MRIEAKGQPNQWMNTSSANWWLNRPRVQQRCRSWWVASAIMHCTFGPSNRSGPQWALSGPPLRSCYIHPENSANLHFQYISGNPCITVEIGTPPWLENWGALILCGSSLSDAMKNPRRSWWGGTGEDGELDGGNKLDIWPKDWDFTQMNCQMLMSSMNPVAVSTIVHSSYFGIVYILILCLCIHFETFFFSSTHCFLIQNHDSSHKYQRYLGEPGMFSFKIPLKFSSFGSKLTVQDHGLDRKNTKSS